MAEIRGVILDVDGTLVESNDAHAWSWRQALLEAGIEAPFQRIRPLIGKGGDKLLPEVSGLAEDTPEGKRISERRGKIFKRDYLPRLRPFARTRELLQRMREEGLKLVVASSAQEEELEDLLEIAGAADLVEHATSADDAEDSKPDPDIVHAALTRSGLAPGEVLMLGDTPYDVEAAARCGVRTLALTCGGWREEDLARAGALAVYADPADLLARYDESPLAARRTAAAGRRT